MRQGFLRSSRYSPGNLDRESLEALFVGRDDIMEDVLSRLTKSIGGQEKHYILLVGPRGSGKTHFLALARHRLMDRIGRAGASETRKSGESHRSSTWSFESCEPLPTMRRTSMPKSPAYTTGSPGTPLTPRASRSPDCGNTPGEKRSCSFARTSWTCSWGLARKDRSGGEP